VRSTIDDVEERNGENVRLLGTSKIGDVDVERYTLRIQRQSCMLSIVNILCNLAHLLSSGSLSDSHGDTENGIGTELALCGSAIELVEELINLGLVLDINVLLEESGCDHVVDVGNSLENT